MDAGTLPAVRVGRRVRIRRSTLEEFIAAGETGDRAAEAIEAQDGEPSAAETVNLPAPACERFAAALAESAAALARDDRMELAQALDSLVGAAQQFADELRADRGGG